MYLQPTRRIKAAPKPVGCIGQPVFMHGAGQQDLYREDQPGGDWRGQAEVQSQYSQQAGGQGGGAARQCKGPDSRRLPIECLRAQAWQGKPGQEHQSQNRIYGADVGFSHGRVSCGACSRGASG